MHGTHGIRKTKTKKNRSGASAAEFQRTPPPRHLRGRGILDHHGERVNGGFRGNAYSFDVFDIGDLKVACLSRPRGVSGLKEA